MEYQLWWTGKTQFGYLEVGIADYIKRIRHLCKFNTLEFANAKEKKDQLIIQQEEETQLLKKIDFRKDYIILLDERGLKFTSIKFAQHLEQLQNNSLHRIIFIIGGAYGFTPAFRNQAQMLLSFSDFTFSHQLIRLIFVEQLYRAQSILHHLPYHHE